MIIKVEKICKFCGTDNSTSLTRRGNLHAEWYKNKFTPGNGWLCRNCYHSFSHGWIRSKTEFVINSVESQSNTRIMIA